MLPKDPPDGHEPEISVWDKISEHISPDEMRELSDLSQPLPDLTYKLRTANASVQLVGTAKTADLANQITECREYYSSLIGTRPQYRTIFDDKRFHPDPLPKDFPGGKSAMDGCLLVDDFAESARSDLIPH